MSRRKRTTEEDDIEEIRKGFEMFDVNHTGIINPEELLEAMDSMNIKEKNPFIYEIIESLNSEKDIKKKGGVDIEELVAYVYNKINDTETNIGLRQIYDVINDRDTDTISMSTFYTLARDYGDQLSEDEIRILLEKTQMGGNELTFDEFYTIMKGSGIKSNYNSSRGPFRNNNNINNNINNEVYIKKSNNNSNISGNNNMDKVRNKKFIYKEQYQVVPEPEPEQEQEQEKELQPEPEQQPEQEPEQEQQPDIEDNQEINMEIDRRYESPKQYPKVENISVQVPQEDNIEPINEDNQDPESNPQYNMIVEELHQENEPEVNIYQKSQEEILSSPKIINPNDINDSQNLNEFSENYPKNENSEIKYDNQENSEVQSETSSQMKYSYRRRKIGAAPKYEKVVDKQVNIEENNINEGISSHNEDTKYKKEKETKVTNMPDGSKKIEITEKTEVVKEKPYVRGSRYRFGRYKNEDNNNNNNNEEDKKEEKKEDKKSYYRIRKPRGNDFNNKNDSNNVNVEENNEVNIPKRYHRRYRESKTSNNNENK